MPAFSIVVSGLGGQGVLFVSKALALAASFENPFVCRTESRGLSQRGGSVSSEVRFSDSPVTPVIGRGSADALLSMDALEAVRCVDLLKPDGVLLSHSDLAPPLHLVRQWNEADAEKSRNEFTEKIIHALQCTVGAILFDLSPKAGRLNVALLGAASNILPLKPDHVRSAILKLTKLDDQDSATRTFDFTFQQFRNIRSIPAKVTAASSVA